MKILSSLCEILLITKHSGASQQNSVPEQLNYHIFIFG